MSRAGSLHVSTRTPTLSTSADVWMRDVQADERFRAQPSNLKQYYARASNGQMVPLDTVVRVSETTAPAVISHFNMYRATELQGQPAPGAQVHG